MRKENLFVIGVILSAGLLTLLLAKLIGIMTPLTPERL
jgi:hypothetical protein